jgi:hypothetical protein
MTDQGKDHFSPRHHALLFAWISKAVFERTDEKEARAIIRKAVRRYGEERGGRMAMRAKANGHKLSMINFMTYGEWRAAPGEQVQEVIAKTPHFVAHVQKCPWHAAWVEEGLLPYGHLYCLEVDEALVRGFNPELRIEVNGTLSQGEGHCEFVFQGANLGLINTLLMGYRRSVKPADSGVMPWAYHMGHLYSTMSDVIGEELGEMGVEVMETAMQNFSEAFGDEEAQMVKAYEGIDFTKLPEEGPKQG